MESQEEAPVVMLSTEFSAQIVTGSLVVVESLGQWDATVVAVSEELVSLVMVGLKQMQPSRNAITSPFPGVRPHRMRSGKSTLSQTHVPVKCHLGIQEQLH